MSAKGYRPITPTSTFDNDSGGDDDAVNVDSEMYNKIRQSREHRLKAGLYIATTLLAVALVAVLLLTWRLSVRSSQKAEGPLSAPNFTSQLGRDTRFMSIDHQYDELWDSLLDKHLGQFATPNDDWLRGEFAMFHQLRCLARFRSAIQKASEGIDVGKDFRDDHWGHCLDYMRRTILCNADGTVERPRVAIPQPDGTIHWGIEGVEEVRTCKSLEPMCERLERDGLHTKQCVHGLDATLYEWPGLPRTPGDR